MTEKTTVTTQALSNRIGDLPDANDLDALRQQIQNWLNAQGVQAVVQRVTVAGGGVGAPAPAQGTPGVVTVYFDPGPGVTANEVKAALT